MYNGLPTPVPDPIRYMIHQKPTHKALVSSNNRNYCIMQFLKWHKKNELNKTSSFLIYGIVSDNASLYLVRMPDSGFSHLSVLWGGGV